MTDTQPTGKFTLPIPLSDRKPDHQVSHKVGGLVLDLFYDKNHTVIGVELSGKIEQLMRELKMK